jgi:hypothetical protein
MTLSDSMPWPVDFVKACVGPFVLGNSVQIPMSSKDDKGHLLCDGDVVLISPKPNIKITALVEPPRGEGLSLRIDSILINAGAEVHAFGLPLRELTITSLLRALRSLGLQPCSIEDATVHLNDGASLFLEGERIDGIWMSRGDAPVRATIRRISDPRVIDDIVTRTVLE